MRPPCLLRTWTIVVAAVLGIGGLAAPAASRATPRLTPGAARRDAEVNAAVRGVMRRDEIPGVILGIWQPGRAPLVRALGSRDVSLYTPVRPKPMKPNLYMRIGSETKTFTATAVLQLVEAGKVGLEDPISRYVEGVPDGDAITVRELGEMRSGIASYTASPTWGREFLAEPERAWKPGELLAASFGLPPTFPPGQSYEYSNTNFVLLGLLVERVSGERIGAYIRRHILAPLRMKHTFFPRGARFPRPHAEGYTAQTPTGKAANSTNWNPAWAWAAGAMISNLHDLRIWAKAVATGTLLAPAIQRQRERFLPIPGLEPARYGFGLFDVDGWIGHDGEVPGYESLTVYLPVRRMTMVILLNSDLSPELSMDLGEAVTRVISPAHLFRFGPLLPSSVSEN